MGAPAWPFVARLLHQPVQESEERRRATVLETGRFTPIDLWSETGGVGDEALRRQRALHRSKERRRGCAANGAYDALVAHLATIRYRQPDNACGDVMLRIFIGWDQREPIA